MPSFTNFPCMSVDSQFGQTVKLEFTSHNPNQYDLQKTHWHNQSLAQCFKILSFSSRWQHGLPLTPFIQIPQHYFLKFLMEKKVSYLGGMSRFDNLTLVSSKAIDSCLFSQIDYSYWCNESTVAQASVNSRSGVIPQVKVICRNDMMWLVNTAH